MFNKLYIESIKEIPEFNKKIIDYLDSGNGFNDLEECLNNIIKDYPNIQLLLEKHKEEHRESFGETGCFERGVFVIDFINSLFSDEINEIQRVYLHTTHRIESYQKRLLKLIYSNQVIKSKTIKINHNYDCIFEAELSFQIEFKSGDIINTQVFLCKIKNIKPYKFEILSYENDTSEVYHSRLSNTLYSLNIPETLNEFDVLKSANKIIDYLVKNKVYYIDDSELYSLKTLIKNYEFSEKSNYNKIYRSYIMNIKENKYIDIRVFKKYPHIIKISSDKIYFTHVEAVYCSSTKNVEEHILEGDYRESILKGKKEIRKHTQSFPYL